MTTTQSARGAAAFTDNFDVADGGWGEIVERLEGFRGLESDWDGEGSEAPEPTIIDGAIKLAKDLEARDVPPAERAIVSVNGTIYFEWRTPVAYYECEVLSSNEAELRIVRTGTDRASSTSIYIPEY